MAVSICECEKPSPWEDNHGKKTNMCQECNGEIKPTYTPNPAKAIEQLHRELDNAVGAAGVSSDKELEELCVLLHTKLRGWVRQTYLTASFNAKVKANEAAAKASV